VTFEEWLATGIAACYCSEPVCDTHDGVPMSIIEREQFEDGYDPCIAVVRLMTEVRV